MCKTYIVKLGQVCKKSHFSIKKKKRRRKIINKLRNFRAISMKFHFKPKHCYFIASVLPFTITVIVYASLCNSVTGINNWKNGITKAQYIQILNTQLFTNRKYQKPKKIILYY
jgi:hypothetical protein